MDEITKLGLSPDILVPLKSLSTQISIDCIKKVMQAYVNGELVAIRVRLQNPFKYFSKSQIYVKEKFEYLLVRRRIRKNLEFSPRPSVRLSVRPSVRNGFSRNPFITFF